MNIQVSPHALKTATALVECEVFKGHKILASKVRDDGNLVEWSLDDGGLIECVRRRDYSTGVPVILDTVVRRYEESPDSSEYKLVFEKKFA
jgi:hypothetical protein